MNRQIVLIEDEPRAAKLFSRMMARLKPEWSIIGHASDVLTATELVSSGASIDAVFSDIELTDGLSFEALRSLPKGIPVVFITAYNQYAIKSFEHYSIDYLLKPLSEEDLLRAIEKLEQNWGNKNSGVMPEFEALISKWQNNNRAYKSRFLVKIGERLKFFSVDDILHFYSENSATYLFTKSKRSFLIDISLEQLEDQLNPDLFFRINRSCITSTDAILDISQYANSRLRLVLTGRENEVTLVSRDRTSAFKGWLDR